ncbi:response regulator [Streptomyces sp. NPDC057565]|uniref:response regulator n=1 Tax=Streptomyces sp. NPDC057565 TaxID=3346169 RepID=UPI0036C17062
MGGEPHADAEGKHHAVLVFEGEPRVRNPLHRALTEEGYAVDTTADGPQAIALTDVAAFDAMVLDVMLSGLDGFEVCAALRRRGMWLPTCPFQYGEGARQPPVRAASERAQQHEHLVPVVAT